MGGVMTPGSRLPGRPPGGPTVPWANLAPGPQALLGPGTHGWDWGAHVFVFGSHLPQTSRVLTGSCSCPEGLLDALV